MGSFNADYDGTAERIRAEREMPYRGLNDDPKIEALTAWPLAVVAPKVCTTVA